MAKNKLDLNDWPVGAVVFFITGILLLVIFITREENPEPVEVKEDWAAIEEQKEKCDTLIEMMKDIYVTKATVQTFLGVEDNSFSVSSGEDFLSVYLKPNNCDRVIAVTLKLIKQENGYYYFFAKDIYEVISQQWNKKNSKIETFYQLEKLNWTGKEKQTSGYLNFYAD